MAGATEKLAAVEDVDIDADGRFKYVLIKCYAGDKDECKCIVRGYARAEYHADVYDEVSARVAGLGVETECLGGGRILHDPKKKEIKVFGYSQGFGRADHSIATELLKKNYPSYLKIWWSNDGY